MTSLGELLRCERERQHRSVADIAQRTRIKPQFIEALEHNDLTVLPGAFFCRSFAQQYAAALELPWPVLKEPLEILLHQFATIDPLPALNQSYRPQGAERRVQARTPVVLTFILLIGVVFGCSRLYELWQRTQLSEGDAIAEADTIAKVGPTGLPASGSPSARPSLEPQPAATPVPDKPPFASPPALSGMKKEVPKTTAPLPADRISLHLNATESSWVSVSSEGKTIFSGVLHPSETKAIQVIESAKLVTGNAGGVDVEWNGRSIGPIGSRGQVRTVVFTANNVQIMQRNKL